MKIIFLVLNDGKSTKCILSPLLDWEQLSKSISHFTPELLKLAHPSQNLDTSIVASKGLSQKSIIE